MFSLIKNNLNKLLGIEIKVILNFFVIGVIFLNYSFPSFANEMDVHFYYTYVMARSVGFNDATAKAIAVSAQRVDDKILTSPMLFDLARLIYHFSGTPSVQDVNAHGNASKAQFFVAKAIEWVGLKKKLIQLLAVASEDHSIPHRLMTESFLRGDLLAVGKAIHSGTDNSAAHVGYSNGPGHAEFEHLPDDISKNTAGFEHMNHNIIQRLIQARMLADDSQLDMQGALEFLNRTRSKSQKLSLADLNDSSKVTEALLSIEDVQKAYMFDVEYSTQYKKIALKSIIDSYEAFGAIKNKEALLKVIPQSLINDPTYTTRDILMLLFVASEDLGDFMKFVDVDSKKEMPILDLDKALAGNKKGYGESKETFEKQIFDEQRKLISEIGFLDSKYEMYQKSMAQLNFISSEVAKHIKVIVDTFSDKKYSELIKSIHKVVDFEEKTAFEKSKSISDQRLQLQSEMKLNIVNVINELKKSGTDKDNKSIEILKEARIQLLREVGNFISAKENFMRKNTALTNALNRVHIGFDSFIASKTQDSNALPENDLKLNDPQWVSAQALKVAQFNAAAKLADNILEGFIPLELNEKRHVLFGNDAALNHQFKVKTKLEVWRSFIALNFGTNFSYEEKLGTTDATAPSKVKDIFKNEPLRNKYGTMDFDTQLIEMLNGKQYNEVLNEMARRTVAELYGYNTVEPIEHAQPLGFNKKSEKAFNWETLIIFAKAGFGLPSLVQRFTAQADKWGRDYLYMTQDQLRAKFKRLNGNKAANEQIKIYEAMENEYKKVRGIKNVSTPGFLNRCQILFKNAI